MAIPFKDKNDVLQQAIQVWSMLDEMSESNPEEYQSFIERQLRDGAVFHSTPQPHVCITTTIRGEKEGKMYINICGWKRVPAPKSDGDPIPVFGGRMETVNLEKEQYSVVEVLFNPGVLQKTEKNKLEKKKLNLLALNFIGEQHNLTLSQHYKLIKEKLKGTVQDMKQRVTMTKTSKSSELELQKMDILYTVFVDTPLLQQISSLRLAESKEDSSIKLSIEQEAPVRPALIEVISSTESEKSQPQQPKHQLSVCTNVGSGSTKILQLVVELPGVRSVSQCQLSISQDDVVLEVEDIYLLHLQFPEMVKEETCTAAFNKKKQSLKVTVNVQ
ncbi:hypothetical protein DNTS_003686 [Danionella cerebrum]|uniref:PIH1 domain-containing protein 2 n=1 Tax=Danionella cerebrum TaxID=2873325 RepID=A0A553QLM4_9TELE|nr:hypothetical protein DNTS_003686 [Danionella translucida]